MAGVQKFAGLKRWFRNERDDYVPVMEVTPNGLITPGDHALWRFRDDFNTFVVSASGIVGWHLDEVNTGTGPTMLDQAFGVVQFECDNAQGDNFHYHWGQNTTVMEPFKPAVGKRFWMFTRFKIEDADQNLVIVGAHVSQDDPWNTEPSDQVVFRTKPGALGTLQFAIGKTNSTEVTYDLGAIVDDTYMRLGAFYDGLDTVHVFRWDDSGDLVTSGKISVTSSARGDLLPDTEMSPAFGMEANDTGTDKFCIDIIDIAMER